MARETCESEYIVFLKNLTVAFGDWGIIIVSQQKLQSNSWNKRLILIQKFVWPPTLPFILNLSERTLSKTTLVNELHVP